MWLFVRSPTLCGSPTVISKEGLAACSTLMLGCPCLRAPSMPGGSCTGGGPRAFDVDMPSSSTSDRGPPLRCWAAARTGIDCSLTGGMGPGSGVGAMSPSGPNGPVASSRASSLVGCSSTRRGVRGVRGPRLAGERGVAVDDRLAGAGLGF